MFRLNIKIQSFSDIITNSSSEVFCRICSKDQLYEIYDVLASIFPGDDPEFEPVIRLDNLDEEIEYLSDKTIKDLVPYKQYASLELPYSMNYPSFFKYGIEGILKERFQKGNYTIFYGDN